MRIFVQVMSNVENSAEINYGVFVSVSPVRNVASIRAFSACSEDTELKDFMDYLDSLKNYEKSRVPKGAGTDSDEGFDLGQMRRLMERLGNSRRFTLPGPRGKGQLLHLCLIYCGPKGMRLVAIPGFVLSEQPSYSDHQGENVGRKIW